MPSHDATTVRKTVDVVGDGERKPFDAVIPPTRQAPSTRQAPLTKTGC